MPGYHCRRYGEYHDELPMSYGADAPEPYYDVAPEDRARRCDATEDQCVIDEEHFFVRGSTEVPVEDGPGPFVWGVWVSLSRRNFLRASELWRAEGRETEPPYFGWLCTRIPCYPDTLFLKTNVHTRAVGLRPLIKLEPTEHP